MTLPDEEPLQQATQQIILAQTCLGEVQFANPKDDLVNEAVEYLAQAMKLLNPEGEWRPK